METENQDEFKDISDLLSGIKSSENQDQNLLDLLSKMYDTKLSLNDNGLYIDQFEDISARIKNSGFYLKENFEQEKLMKYLQDFITNIKPKKNLLETPKNKQEEGEEGEPTPITQVNFVEDYYSLFKKISWCGISLNEKESYLLVNSIRNLSAKLQVGMLTFFGKIYGTEKDYYIVQGSDIDPKEDANYDNDMEKRKEDGVNKNVFFVTNDLSEKWVELPDVKPSQIRISRQIKYTLTGNLENPIHSNPTFIGTEKHYLKCIIVRIYHGAKIVPSINHFTIEDPESPFKPLTPAEKPKQLKYNDLINMDNWIHFPPGILACGRVSHMTEEPPEGVDPEEFKKQVIAKDPFDKRMQKISEDKKIFINQKVRIKPWRIDVGYEDSIYINPYIKLLDETQPDFDPNEQKDNTANFLAICIRSLRWPGAVNIWSGKETYFFYFGNGQKYLEVNEKPYVFKDFPKIPVDRVDKEDQPEPHVLKTEEPKKEEGK